MMARRHSGLMFIAVCVAALALRLLLPAGFMPAGNGFALSICGSAAGQDAGQPADGADTACDFALSGAPLLLAAAAFLLLPLLPVLPLPAIAPPLPAMRRHRPCPPGRGPPRL